MLSRFVEEGSKVELRALEHGLGESGAENTTKVYQSRVPVSYTHLSRVVEYSQYGQHYL